MKTIHRLSLFILILVAFLCLTGAQHEQMPTVKVDAITTVAVDGNQLQFAGRDGNLINSKGEKIGSITFGEKRTITARITIQEP